MKEVNKRNEHEKENGKKKRMEKRYYLEMFV